MSCCSSSISLAFLTSSNYWSRRICCCMLYSIAFCRSSSSWNCKSNCSSALLTIPRCSYIRMLWSLFCISGRCPPPGRSYLCSGLQCLLTMQWRQMSSPHISRELLPHFALYLLHADNLEVRELIPFIALLTDTFSTISTIFFFFFFISYIGPFWILHLLRASSQAPFLPDHL